MQPGTAGSRSARKSRAGAHAEQIRAGALGPWDFHTEKWEAAYIRRIDATMAALKTAGVPVTGSGCRRSATPRRVRFGLSQRDLPQPGREGGHHLRRCGDGFVDESGRFTQQGPDYEGQTRRLRSGDGVFFTKFGARKLAHYVEREIQRHITNRAVPVALPIPVEPGATKPGGPAQRPAVGPVIPLTASAAPPMEELMGGGRAPRQVAPDPVASRVLTKGEPITAPTGRADDFAWPRGSAPIAEPVALQPTPPCPPTPGAGATAQRGTTDAQAGDPKQAPSGPARLTRRARRSRFSRAFSADIFCRAADALRQVEIGCLARPDPMR